MDEPHGAPTVLGAHEHMDDEMEDITGSLPPAPFVFAYGSAVFPQEGVAKSDRMLDFILAVDSPPDWHAENMMRNPKHYSMPVRMLGPAAASNVQQSSFGARVYYNTLLTPLNKSAGRNFKYGIIGLADLQRDLQGWDSLYIAGRMHKPIRVVTRGVLPPGVRQAVDRNLTSATSAALLTLPARFTETELYLAAARLSYSGDIRMSFRAEVEDKVQNIVRPNLSLFRGLYEEALSDMQVSRSSSGVWEREMGSAGQLDLIRRLPHRVLTGVTNAIGIPHVTGADAVAALSERDAGQLRAALLATISAIVFKSSMRQSLKGLLTAGLGTSVRYVSSKFSKALAGRGRAMSSMKRAARDHVGA